MAQVCDEFVIHDSPGAPYAHPARATRILFVTCTAYHIPDDLMWLAVSRNARGVDGSGQKAIVAVDPKKWVKAMFFEAVGKGWKIKKTEMTLSPMGQFFLHGGA